jgi:hypothetical protein
VYIIQHRTNYVVLEHSKWVHPSIGCLIDTKMKCREFLSLRVLGCSRVGGGTYTVTSLSGEEDRSAQRSILGQREEQK